MFDIIADSACDWRPNEAQAKNVTLVPLYVTFDGKNYFKEGVDIDHKQFYKEMIENKAFPKTSLPTTDDFIKAIEPSVANGRPVMVLCISTSLSGSYQSALIAKDILLEKYPKAKIAVIDTLADSSNESLIVYEAVRMRDDGINIKTAAKVIRMMAKRAGIIFTTDSLEYMDRGGRLGKMILSFGSKLKLHTLIIFKAGKFSLGGFNRTRKTAIQRIFKTYDKHFKSEEINTRDYFFNAESGTEHEECNHFRKEFECRYGVKCLESQVDDFHPIIGAVTASHAGPRSLGVGYVPKYETLLEKIREKEV